MKPLFGTKAYEEYLKKRAAELVNEYNDPNTPPEMLECIEADMDVIYEVRKKNLEQMQLLERIEEVHNMDIELCPTCEDQVCTGKCMK